MKTNALLAAGLAVLGLSACRDEPVSPLAPDTRLAVLAAPSAPTGSAAQDLGTLGNVSQAFGISPNGTFVVGEFDALSGESRAFIWTSKTGMTQLPTPAGSTFDWATSVNDAGQVVGYSNIPSQNAFLWAKGVAYNLGTLAGGAGASRALGINRSGQVVGESSTPGEFQPGPSHAMLWMPTATNGTTGTMYDLGTLGGSSSLAYAVNDAGQVVGTALVGGVLHAFLWTPNVPNGTVGTMVDLAPTGPYAEAYGFNDWGDVVGQHEVAGGGVGAFIWNAATGMRELGTFPGGGNSAAFGVDRTGRAVGAAQTSPSNPFRPVIWTSKSGIQDLGTLGGAAGQAFGTNPKGKQAVGYSQTAGGDVHATLWNLP